jgi:hypothetical protein
MHAFVSKFLEGKDIEMLKEKLKLNEFGKCLKDEGKKEKAIEIAKIAIKKGMDNEIISELTGLSIWDVELIRETLK